MSFLSAVSLIFSVCSPKSLSFTSGQQQKSSAGDREGREAEAEPRKAQDCRMYHMLPRHSVCQCPSHHLKNTNDTPSFFTLDYYHSNTLFCITVWWRKAVSANHQVIPSPRQTYITMLLKLCIYTIMAA